MRRFFLITLIVLPSFLFGQGDKILSRHLEKYGQTTWSQIQTLKILGKHVNEEYKAFPITIINKENNQVRVDGQNYILALDHQVFWTSGLTNENLPLEKLVLQYALTIGSPLSKFREDLKYGGLEVVDGTMFHAFKKQEVEHLVTYLIDKESEELRHMILEIKGKEPVEARLSFDKYKSHHGLLMPTAITVRTEDGFKEWVFDEILLGTAIDDQLFVKPNSQ
ncbi:MAG: hypothetical protein KI791_12880 [Cyclobacteriaceae bacterium]|nr:hypothetical protein [Cyclobacteriaceae bacterium SS2]